jgi:uncharacterized protein (TIGR04255 family)
LNEVLLGVQFAPAPGYQLIRAEEVWALFRDEYPIVEEMPPLSPNFETFGVPQAFPISFVSQPMHPRFWFLSEKREQLLQFQNDRLLHNWRKAGLGDENNPYPRFETIIAKFESEMAKLESHFGSLGAPALTVQQCEISYINRIYAEKDSRLDPAKWLRFVSFPGEPPEAFTCSFRRVLSRPDGTPYGRLICESAIAFENPLKPFILFTLTARGIPSDPNSMAALDFLSQGRDMIVRLFANLTTDSAHKLWGRTQ